MLIIMMRSWQQTTYLTGFMLAAFGIAYASIAQVPPITLPPLSNAPVASAPSAPATPSAPAAPSANSPLSAGASPAKQESTTDTEAAAPAKLAGLPPPPNESGDSPVPQNKAAASPLAPLPSPTAEAKPEPPTLDLSMPLPALPAASAGGTSAKSMPSIPTPTPLPIAEKPKAEEVKKPPQKSWMTTLAPSVKIPTLGYRYRRDVLPGAIYRTRYTLENRHLPVFTGQEDYARWYLASVARNDVNATRALLNEGVPMNTANVNGESALAIAQRYGAADTARLLMARGAR